MGTRGLYVFRYNGIYYIFYNQCDSYTGGLGKLIVKDIKNIINNNQINELKECLSNIVLIDENNKGSIHYNGLLNAV